MALTLPRVAGAFWPFSPAEGAGSDEPILHDTKLALLEAATNSDPSPFKGSHDIETTEGSALIANVGPEGTIPDASSVQNGGHISLYVVREGDTLSVIADMFGVSANTIKWANNIKDSKLISPGDELLILPIERVELEEVPELSESARGEGKFGSTGRN